MPVIHPSDTAPSARIAASFTSQSCQWQQQNMAGESKAQPLTEGTWEERFCLSKGRKTGRRDSLNTLERTSRAAAEHLRKFQSERQSATTPSSSLSPSSSPSLPSAPPLPPSVMWDRARWKRGLISESLSGTSWSSSESACRGESSHGWSCMWVELYVGGAYLQQDEVYLGILHSIQQNRNQSECDTQ